MRHFCTCLLHSPTPAEWVDPPSSAPAHSRHSSPAISPSLWLRSRVLRGGIDQQAAPGSRSLAAQVVKALVIFFYSLRREWTVTARLAHVLDWALFIGFVLSLLGYIFLWGFLSHWRTPSSPFANLVSIFLMFSDAFLRRAVERSWESSSKSLNNLSLPVGWLWLS